MQRIILIWGSSKHNEMTMISVLLPFLQLIQSVGPMAATAEQSHHNQLGILGSNAEVMINLGWVSEAGQGKGSDPIVPRDSLRPGEAMR
tara:strand:- start:167 stop:433 length:267 start_codon:yes stop_codon:yes gene_type:complete